ncbi:DNA-3-methyladenine glycosylase I [Candidatus Wolfebacteria bacterium]|nr:MAG: DNA-3-methyladenine glycosylase I [Candidatus Wolfebacteria bacterium]
MKVKKRCSWPTHDLMLKYHDEEWGVPEHDDNKLFEMITLEGAQAGLSWDTVLKKRARYVEVFKKFDIKKVARMTARDEARLLKDAGIIRNRLKVSSTITNAKAIIEIQMEFGSFDTYIWQFVDSEPKKNKFKSIKQMPATTPESDAMSKDMKKRGFRFVGSTICYAFMQATGMVNDHEVTCFRYKGV